MQPKDRILVANNDGARGAQAQPMQPPCFFGPYNIMYGTLHSSACVLYLRGHRANTAQRYCMYCDIETGLVP